MTGSFIETEYGNGCISPRRNQSSTGSAEIRSQEPPSARGGRLFDKRRSNIYKPYRATRCGPGSSVDPAEQLIFYDHGLGTAPPGLRVFVMASLGLRLVPRLATVRFAVWRALQVAFVHLQPHCQNRIPE